MRYELTSEHKKDRVDFAKYMLLRGSRFRSIVFADETSIMLKGEFNRLKVWKFPGSPRPSVEFRGSDRRKVMFYGFITYDGVGIICPIDGTFTSDTYIGIIERYLKPYLDDEFSPILVHDNASPHRSKRTTAALVEAGIDVERLPPLSPDLNPIEKVWAILKRNLIGRSFNRPEELIDATLEAWNGISRETIRGLYGRWVGKLEEVVENDGEN